MPDGSQSKRRLPSDLAQIPTVWRYELLKYMRSKRLIAAIAVVLSVIALLYLLPPALGEPYSGTDTERSIYIVDTDDLGIVNPGLTLPQYVGFVNRSVVSELELFRNGQPYPSANGLNWTFTQLVVDNARVNLIFFMENVIEDEITATYHWRTSPQEFDSLFLNFASILVVICATFFAADSVVSEFQNRTGYLILPNPMKRETLFLGKFIASFTMGAVVMALFYAGITTLSFVTAKGVDDDFPASFGFSLAYILAAMGVAYLISSVLKGGTGALVLTFFLFMMILPIVDGVSAFAGVKIEGSVTFAAGTISYILYDPYPIDSSQEIPGMGFTIYNYYPDPGTALAVMLGYCLGSVLLSLLIFRRRQLVG